MTVVNKAIRSLFLTIKSHSNNQYHFKFLPTQLHDDFQAPRPVEGDAEVAYCPISTSEATTNLVSTTVCIHHDQEARRSP